MATGAAAGKLKGCQLWESCQPLFAQGDLYVNQFYNLF